MSGRSELNGLGREIEEHWRRHHPRIFRDPSSRDILYQALKEAEDRTWANENV